MGFETVDSGKQSSDAEDNFAKVDLQDIADDQKVSDHILCNQVLADIDEIEIEIENLRYLC